MPLVSFLLARFAEPSSYAGLAALLALAGVNLPASTLAVVVQCAAGACAVAAFIMRELNAGKSLAQAAADIAASVPKPPVSAMVGILTAATLAIGLSACQGGAQNTGVRVSQDTAAVTQIALVPADVDQLKATCAANQATINLAAADSNKVVAGTAVYPKAFCDQLLAGTVPPTADKSSLSWLPSVLSAVSTAASVAGRVLPVVLPLL